MYLKVVLMSCMLNFSTYTYAENVNPYPYSVIECKGCSLDEVETIVSRLAKLDEVVTVALVDSYEGKAYTYDVEKYIDKQSVTEAGDYKFVTKITPKPVDPEIVQGAKQLREMLVDMWDLNSEQRKEWLRQEAKKPLKPGQDKIFVVDESHNLY